MSIPMIQTFSKKMVERIHSVVKEEIFSKGETIISEGEKSQYLYAIVEGEVILSNKGNPFGEN
jgi:CRP-like cAMP-binding protein